MRIVARFLFRTKVAIFSDAAAAAETLLNKGVKNVIVTCGSRGALVKNADTCAVVPACRVSAVDTTAAGDVFNGALTVALAEGLPLLDAARFATHAAALSVTRIGAQSSSPTRREVDDARFANNGRSADRMTTL